MFEKTKINKKRPGLAHFFNKNKSHPKQCNQIWRNFATYAKLSSEVRLVLGKLSYLPWHCYATVQIVIFENGQRLNNNTATWSH